MNRMKTVLFVFFGIILLVVICFFIERSKATLLNNPDLDGDGMTDPNVVLSFHFQRGGGDLGASYSLTLENGKLTVEKCEGNGYKTKSKSYTVPNETVGKIQEILAGADIRCYGNDFPKSDLTVLDGETSYVSVVFADGVKVSFDSGLEVPEGGWKAIYEVVELLENIADK